MDIEKLKTCPFCGGNNIEMRPSYNWTGTRNVMISMTIIHWCEREEGQPQSTIQIKGKTQEDAERLWNQRN